MSSPSSAIRSWAPSVYLAFLFAMPLIADEFPTPYNSEQNDGRRLAPQEAAAQIALPEGFHASLFAAEPDVQNPIAMTIDARGRLWVAENYTYAEGKTRFELRLRDRLLILEDTDGDGRMDQRKVFTDQLQMLASVALGPDGAWVLCPPALLFIPDANQDDIPDGPPEVVLDGFDVSNENYHTFANGLKWGPDGWLYGRCGASCAGEVGAPDMSPEKHVPVRGGIWRYHPRRYVFETLTSGTTNPWGHDWDAHGELFFVNTVNGHLWHGITGAHFARPHTIDPNPHVYATIDQHADHYHFDTGRGWQASRDGAANELGGGHAHCGTLIYQGDNWPAKYRDKLLTLNLHGRRINCERLERQGSGYVAHHEPDFAVFADPWFRGLDLVIGPDGGVFVSDWSDTGECHEATGVHRTSGRIFKVTYGDHVAKPAATWDIREQSSQDLVQLHFHPNAWFARQAAALLEERQIQGAALTQVKAALRRHLATESSAAMRLRALWTLNRIQGVTEQDLKQLLRDGDEHLRVWAIRLLVDRWPLDTVLGKRPHQTEEDVEAELLAELVRISSDDQSGLVRLTLASTLQRLPLRQRSPLAAALMQHMEDAGDHNLPLLVWYGLAPLANAEPISIVPLAKVCQWPQTRRCFARRLAENLNRDKAPLDALLDVALEQSAAFQADVLAGMSEGLAGWRSAPRPAVWAKVQQQLASDKTLGEQVRDLSVLFGDGRALDEVRRLALDENADIGVRTRALETLVEAAVDAKGKKSELQGICEKLLSVRFLNVAALRGLAEIGEADSGTRIVRAYRSFHQTDRPKVISALVTRSGWTVALLDAIAAGKIPRDDLTPYQARQIRALRDGAVDERLRAVWGELRDSPEEKQQLVQQLKSMLTAQRLAKADPSLGRALFVKTCASCHTLYGEGGRRGPDLTGSQRTNLDYLLENIADPSATVAADFRVSNFALADGRVLTGIVSARTENTITLMTQTEAFTIERAKVESQQVTPQSLMPDGLLQPLTSEQICDLFAYLTTRQQVPLAKSDDSPKSAP